MDFLSSFDWILDPTVVTRQFMAGLANGMLLFLVAAGLSLIFGVSRIINFAHGGIFMLGAYVAFTVVSLMGQSIPAFILALAISTIFTFLFGVAFEMLFLRRIYRSPQAFQLLLTFGLVLILGDAVQADVGPRGKFNRRAAGLDGIVRPFGVSFPDLPPRAHRGRDCHLRRTLDPTLSQSLGNAGSRGHRRSRDATSARRRCQAALHDWCLAWAPDLRASQAVSRRRSCPSVRACMLRC